MDEAQRRFTVVDKPPALPGVCLICRGEDREWFIDLAIDVEFHGAGYLCATCFEEFASMVGYAPVGDIGMINKQLQDIKNWDASIAETAEGLENVYRELGRSLTSLSSFRDDISSNPSDVQEPSRQTDGVSSEPAEESRTDSGTSDEQGDESGLADVRPTPEQPKFKLGNDF